MASPRSISLYLTLGVAAIDMLSCAFIASVLLFIMFLVPAPAPADGAAGSERSLAFLWVMDSGKAVLRLSIKPPNADTVVIWSDTPDVFQARPSLCANLSKKGTDLNACRLFVPPDSEKAHGMLHIDNPVSGPWNVEISFGDSWKHMNAEGPSEVNVGMTVIGRDTISATLRGLRPRQPAVGLRGAAASEGNTEASINASLNVP